MRTLANNAMHTDSAITLRFQSEMTDAEPVMANRWAGLGWLIKHNQAYVAFDNV